MKRKILIGITPVLMMAYTVSFEQVLKETYENNEQLKAKKLTIDMAKENVEKAKSYDWGRLYFEESVVKTNDVTAAVMGHSAGDDKKHFDTRINYDIYGFTGFKVSEAKAMANLQVKAKKYKYQRDRNKLGIDVLKAYNGVVAAKQFIEALEKAKQTTGYFVHMTHDLYNQGMIVYSDVLSAEKRDRDVDAKMIEARNKYKLALAYIRFLTGNNTISDVKDFKIVIAPGTNLVKLQEEALKNRNDLKEMHVNVLTMKHNVKMNENIKYPSIGIHADYGIGDHNRKNDSHTIGAALRYYFFNMEDSQVLQYSKIQAQQVALYEKYMKNGIKLDVQQKYLTLQEKTSLIEAKIKNQEAAKSILDKYKDMYKNGLINIAILLMKQAESQKADAELIKAKYDQAIAAAELKLAIGSPVETDENVYREEDRTKIDDQNLNKYIKERHMRITDDTVEEE